LNQALNTVMDSSLRNRAVSAFAFLEQADDAFRSAFFEAVRLQQLAARQFIAMEGDSCHALPLMLSGQARVYKMGDQGREITLYRIAPGESCILTASCILGNRDFPAFAHTDGDAEMLVVPSGAVRKWMHDHPAWRQFVFQLIARRLVTVIETVDEVTFQRLDARLAAHLLDQLQTAKGDALHVTHETIASELGSSREVISRQLKMLEQEGLVTLGRGVITVHDPAGLRHTAQVV